MQPNEISEVLNRPISRELLARDLARLLIRGLAELDFVEGIPDEYLESSGTYQMTSDPRIEWEAKLIDFETTPSPVEELVRQRDERRRS